MKLKKKHLKLEYQIEIHYLLPEFIIIITRYLYQLIVFECLKFVILIF